MLSKEKKPATVLPFKRGGRVRTWPVSTTYGEWVKAIDCELCGIVPYPDRRAMKRKMLRARDADELLTFPNGVSLTYSIYYMQASLTELYLHGKNVKYPSLIDNYGEKRSREKAPAPRDH